MQKDMDRLVWDCELCWIKTLQPLPLQNLGVDPPHKLMVRLAVDLWTCESGTALTTMNRHSQYPFIVFLKDKTLEETARVISEILAGIATPQEILSDNGKEFMGKEFQEVLSKQQIKHITTAAYLPQSNGILEQFHRYLKQCVSMSLKHHAAMDKDGWYWKGACLAALEAYRKLPHTSTGECPLFLATGQDPLYTINHLLPTVPQEIWQQEGATTNLDPLTYAHALAWCNTVMAWLHNKDLTLPWDTNVKLGDRVYKQNMRANKLDPRWLTRYQVVHIDVMHCSLEA